MEEVRRRGKDQIGYGETSPIARLEPRGAEHPLTMTGLDSRKMGIWMFIASEVIFFMALITTFLLYRAKTPYEQPDDGAGTRRDPRRPCGTDAILVAGDGAAGPCLPEYAGV